MTGYGQDTATEIRERVAGSDPLGVTSWWAKYKSYVMFAVGGFAGWTLCKLISAPTVIVRSGSGVSASSGGLGRVRGRRVRR